MMDGLVRRKGGQPPIETLTPCLPLRVNQCPMEGSFIVYGLHVGLAIALLIALFIDFRHRIIPNWLNAVIALAAPVFWWVSGYALWPDIAIQIGVALAVLLVFALVFQLGQMGGGDVKLLVALALWLPLQQTYWMVILTSLIGLVVTLVFLGLHKWSRKPGRPSIPYGIAIALSGLWVIGERYFNHLA